MQILSFLAGAVATAQLHKQNRSQTNEKNRSNRTGTVQKQDLGLPSE